VRQKSLLRRSDIKDRLIENTPTIARINVTPIIDVALVLVIILLVTAPMLVATDLDVNLPQAHTRDVEDEVRLSITVGITGDLAVDDEAVEPETLEAVLSSRLAGEKNENVLVVVRADAGVSHKTVRTILKSARAAGARRLAVGTRQKGKGQS